MRTINIEPKTTSKPFTFAQIRSNFMLPGLPNGITKMLNGPSHHTQRRKTRPNPTSLLRIPEETQFIGRLNKNVNGPMPRGTSRSKIQQAKNTSFIIRTKRKRRSCRNRFQMLKKAGSEPQGASNKLNTSPCARSQRPRVCQLHANMCFNMCAWCWYTRRRFERTHGDVFEWTHGEGRETSSVQLTKICSPKDITCFRGPPKKPLNLTHVKFENRSRTTCLQFLQSFALPDKAVQFQLS